MLCGGASLSSPECHLGVRVDVALRDVLSGHSRDRLLFGLGVILVFFSNVNDSMGLQLCPGEQPWQEAAWGSSLLCPKGAVNPELCR